MKENGNYEIISVQQISNYKVYKFILMSNTLYILYIEIYLYHDLTHPWINIEFWPQKHFLSFLG